MARLADQIRDLFKKLPPNQFDRIKLIAACVCILVCGVLITAQLGESLRGHQRARPLNTEGWKIANSLSDDISKLAGMSDVSLNVLSESPLKFDVVGMVRSEEDLDLLYKVLKENRPQEDYEVNVVVTPHG